MNKSFQALIDDFEKYKTTKTDTHSGDLLEHSAWTAFYVNDLFTKSDMQNPLHRVWNKVIDDQFENESIFEDIDIKKILIISSFLHDIGKGGDGVIEFYEKPNHEKIGVEYLNKRLYKTVNGSIINLTNMFNDFDIGFIETEIIKILIKGHLSLGHLIFNKDGPSSFVEGVKLEYDNSKIQDFDKYLFALIVMMQLIVCIADVLAMKEYKGKTKTIPGYKQIPFKKAPHESITDIYEDYNYEKVIDEFVPEVYGYVFDNYINNINNNPLQEAINTLDTIDFDRFEHIIVNDINEDIDDSLIEELIEGCISLKRFDLLIIIMLNIGFTGIRISLNELLDNSMLVEFITYVKTTNVLKKFQKTQVFNKLLFYIIDNNITEGIIPFIIYHKDLIGLRQLNEAKNSYKEAMDSGNNVFEAKQIYNEIKGSYNIPEGFYKSDKHRLYCESIEPTVFPEPLIVDTKKIIFEIPSIMRSFKIGYLNNISMANQLIDIDFTLTKDNYGGGISSLFGDDFTLDSEWIYKSIKYINDLPIEDKFTVLGYTHNGDELVNTYLLGNNPKLKTLIDNYYYESDKEKYNDWFLPIFFQMVKVIMSKRRDILINKTDKLTLPKLRSFISNSVISETYEHILTKLKLFSYDFYVDCIRMYEEDLKRIINNSPPMTNTSILYRGVKDKYYYPDPSNKVFKSSTFISTSYNPESAYEFSSLNCCFKKIIAKPGTKGLFIEAVTLHSGEFEVLLSSGNSFNIIEDKVGSGSYKEKQSFSDICKGELKDMEITTMEIIL